MEFLTVPDGRDPREFRSAMSTKYEARVLDMMLPRWTCASCGSDVAAKPLVVPAVEYRTLDDAVVWFTKILGEVATKKATMSGVPGQELAVAIHMPPEWPNACPRCNTAPQLVGADVLMWNTDLRTDVALRLASGAGPQLFANGNPLAWNANLASGFTRDALVRSIAVAREDDDVDAGEAVMMEAARTMPGDPALLASLPWLNNNRRADAVLAMADATAARFPDRADGYFWRAQVLVQASNETGNPALADQAAPLLERTLAIDPKHGDAGVALANLARVRRRDDEAMAILQRVLSANPEHAVGQFTLGLMLLPTKPADALRCFEIGERLDPRDPDYPRAKAQALIALGRKEEARVAIGRAMELGPNDPRVQQVAQQVAGDNPIANTIKLVTRLIVFGVLLGVVGTVLYVLHSAGVF